MGSAALRPPSAVRATAVPPAAPMRSTTSPARASRSVVSRPIALVEPVINARRRTLLASGNGSEDDACPGSRLPRTDCGNP